MADNITIREFRYPEDYPSVYSLWENAGPGIQLQRSDQLKEIEKKQTRDPDLFLLAETEGLLVGAVLGGFDGRRGLVYHLSVLESHRLMGVGKRLMNELELRFISRGCIRCYLLVTAENMSAMRFYEALGWGEMELKVFAKDLIE